MTNNNAGKSAPEAEPEEARQGEIGRDGNVRGPMRYVLIISTAAVIVAFIIALLVVRG